MISLIQFPVTPTPGEYRSALSLQLNLKELPMLLRGCDRALK